MKGWARLSTSWLDAGFLDPRAVLDGAAAVGGAAVVVLARLRIEGAVLPTGSEAVQAARLRAAGDRRGMPMLDHIVIGRLSYWSLHDQETP